MAYELRNPQASDLIAVSKIIKTIGLKNIADCFNTDELTKYKNELSDKSELTDEDTSKAGLMVMTSIGELVLEKLELVQNDVFKFMGNLSSKGIDEISTMDIVEFAEMFMDIIKNPKFADFIKVVLKSFK